MKLKIKKILSILNVIILFTCSTLPFIYIENYETNLNIMGVGFLVSFGINFLYMFILLFNLHKVQKIYTLLLLTTYGYIVYEFLKDNILSSYEVYEYGMIGLLVIIISIIIYGFKTVIIKSKSVFSYIKLFIFLSTMSSLYTFVYVIVTDFAHFEIGGYLFILSFAINSVMHFFLTDEVHIVEKGKKNIEKPINVDPEYMIVIYRGEIDKTEKLTNRLGVIMSKKEGEALEFGIHAEYPFNVHIDPWNLIKITVSKTEPEAKIKKDEVVSLSLAGIIIKSFGAFVASDHLVDEIDKYIDFESNESYKIEIVYTENKKVQKAIFCTKQNPDNLLKKYGEKYSFED